MAARRAGRSAGPRIEAAQLPAGHAGPHPGPGPGSGDSEESLASAGDLDGDLDGDLGGEIERIVAWYRQAGRALRAGDPTDWAAGVTMPQLRVLFFLGRAGPASVGDVAGSVGVAQPSATETLDRLVRAGLVERAADAGDRRVVRNALTPAGRELIAQPWETRRAVLASALRHASPDDRAAIARGLELLCRALARADNAAETISASEGAGARHGLLDGPTVGAPQAEGAGKMAEEGAGKMAEGVKEQRRA